jgi:hypothetical protein
MNRKYFDVKWQRSKIRKCNFVINASLYKAFFLCMSKVTSSVLRLIIVLINAFTKKAIFGFFHVPFFFCLLNDRNFKCTGPRGQNSLLPDRSPKSAPGKMHFTSSRPTHTIDTSH